MADLLKVGEIAARFLTKKADLQAVNVGREWRIAKDLENIFERHADPRRTMVRRRDAPNGTGPTFGDTG